MYVHNKCWIRCILVKLTDTNIYGNNHLKMSIIKNYDNKKLFLKKKIIFILLNLVHGKSATRKPQACITNKSINKTP